MPPSASTQPPTSTQPPPQPATAIDDAPTVIAVATPNHSRTQPLSSTMHSSPLPSPAMVTPLPSLAMAAVVHRRFDFRYFGFVAAEKGGCQQVVHRWPRAMARAEAGEQQQIKESTAGMSTTRKPTAERSYRWSRVEVLGVTEADGAMGWRLSLDQTLLS
ncbi:hypothetical protein Dimus_028849 [Dionaea muscipula]